MTTTRLEGGRLYSVELLQAELCVLYAVTGCTMLGSGCYFNRTVADAHHCLSKFVRENRDLLAAFDRVSEVAQGNVKWSNAPTMGESASEPLQLVKTGDDCYEMECDHETLLVLLALLQCVRHGDYMPTRTMAYDVRPELFNEARQLREKEFSRDSSIVFKQPGSKANG